MTTSRGAGVRQGLAVDVYLHGRRFIVAEFTAFAVLFAGLSVATLAATIHRAAHRGVPSLGWLIAAAFLAVLTGWTTNCVAAIRLARSLTPTPPPEQANLWPLTVRLLATLLIPFAAVRR